jgi:hypothetical protein
MFENPEKREITEKILDFKIRISKTHNLLEVKEETEEEEIEEVKEEEEENKIEDHLKKQLKSKLPLDLSRM